MIAFASFLLAAEIAAAPAAATSPALTIALDVVVEDARKRPVTDLTARQVEITQDGEKQTLADLRKASAAGHYELTYVPSSGKPGAVSVRVLRPGASVRGPLGAFLKPRVIAALSPLAAELAGILDAA